MVAARLGLLGHPIGQSRSPILHAAAAASVGLEVTYDLFDVPPADVAAWLARPPAGLTGFNVTAPHKQIVHGWVQALGPAARRLGVVNTVCCGARPTGWNTDLFGFAQALGDPPDGPAVVLGAGGAARAVVAALHDAGVRSICVAARRPAQAQGVLDRLGVRGRARPLDRGLIDDAGLIVDAIGPPAAAWLADLPFETACAQARFISLSYAPPMAPVLAAVRAVERRAEDGLAMLGWQGVAAFERWTGRRPDPQTVFAALRAAAPRVDTRNRSGI